MKDKGYYKRWLIPQLGCNENIVFQNRPVGNSPKFMPLDMSLNNDIQLNFSLHCAITGHLSDDDPRKFSMRTPKTIVCGIMRLWGAEGNVPLLQRIIQDCDKALRDFRVVYRAGGKMVPGLANRRLHRNHAEGRNKDDWGGVRVRNMLVEEVGRWLHRDAEEVKSEQIAELIEFLQNQQQEVEVSSDQ